MFRLFQLTIAAYLACFVFWAHHARAQTPLSPGSPAELATHLREIESSLDTNSASRLDSLPENWGVVTPEGRYSIPSQPLRALLGAKRIEPARQWLHQMADQLETYSKPPVEAAPGARASLDRILARREFSGVHPPSPWELFRDRVAAWIASLLQRLFGFVGQHGASARVLFWVLVAATIGLLAMWLIRLWRRGDPMLALPPVVPQTRPRDWETWVREARQAAGRGEWREAIHCVYWAAVARLQESRTLPEDRTRTPREYLRLIPAEQSASSALRALTSGLERFWYAGQAANAGDFSESLKHLESLGCRLD